VPGQTLVIVSDAHIGAAPAQVEAALLDFLDAVPALGDSLLINGDLFQFWFAYRQVIPRRGFTVAARVAALARQVPVAIVGGNHDRWGSAFWGEQPGIRYDRDALRLNAGGRRVLAVHGDGLPPRRGFRPLLQRIVGHPITSTTFRWLHPDLGMPLASAAAPFLGGTPATPAQRDQRAEEQRQWAEAALQRDPSADLLVMGHTHAPALHEMTPGRTYLNPGAWVDGLHYAVVHGADVRLLQHAAPHRGP
jgi:UDP-2,3-diacylglucosamine hydrolase